MEEWRDIKDYEGLYQVSNLGRVKSLRFGKEKILKPSIDKNGYRQCFFRKDNATKRFKIGRLVALVFIPNPENLPTVDHLDRNRLNDFVENLRWASRSENNKNRDFSNFKNNWPSRLKGLN